jgi:cobalamin biosynthetic protein CobC
LLVVDESFADLEGEGFSLAPHLPQPGLLVLRSLSKGYGLGGVRLGFALAEPGITASIRAALGPWPVSGPAVEVGALALTDGAWLETTKQQLTKNVTRLDEMLREAGLTVLGGTLLSASLRVPRPPPCTSALARPASLFAASITIRAGSA